MLAAGQGLLLAHGQDPGLVRAQGHHGDQDLEVDRGRAQGQNQVADPDLDQGQDHEPGQEVDHGQDRGLDLEAEVEADPVPDLVQGVSERAGIQSLWCFPETMFFYILIKRVV